MESPSPVDPLPADSPLLTGGVLSEADPAATVAVTTNESRAEAAQAGGPLASEGTSALEAPRAPADGVALVHAGNLSAAEVAFRQAIERSPHEPGLRHNLAVVLARQKKLDEAVIQFREALRLKPDAAETHRNLALALGQQGRRPEAEQVLREAVRLDPKLAAARHELGNALRISGRLDEALVHLREAVALRGDVAEGHHDLGLALAELGQPPEAVACYERALRLRPEFPEALNNLGILLEDRGDHAGAEAQYRAALRLRPESADTLNNLGVALAAARRHEEAVQCYRDALRLNPRSPLALNNLGNALRTLGCVDEAAASLAKAIELRPDYAEAHNNLGICLMQFGRRDQALRCYEQALHLRPSYPEAHLNRSLAWLGDAEFSRGWTEYEWRWQGKEVKRRSLGRPLWSGARAPEATLFLYFEQGLGDTLQFIRYAELARKRVGRIVMEVQAPLVPLLSRCRGVDELIPAGAAPPKFDFHLPLLSLPGALGTQLETIPADVPYIFADPERMKSWQQRLEHLGGCRVGIGWQGNPQYRGDRQRSIPLEHFARLAVVPRVRLVSLQKGDGTAQIARFEERLRSACPGSLPAAGALQAGSASATARAETSLGASPHPSPLPWGEGENQRHRQEADRASRPLEVPARREDAGLVQFGDLDAAGGAFVDTAAILRHLDLVITSDTALAHLSGAMEIDTWVALPYAADWRWLRDRDDSPWYPTVRLFRQVRPDDWTEVFERMAAELAARALHAPARRSGSAPAASTSREVTGTRIMFGAKPPAAAIAEFRKGTESAKTGDHVRAEEALRSAIALHAEYAEAHHNLGVVLARTGRHRDAESAFRRALEIKPDYSEAMGNLGLAYLELGEPAAAATVLRGAVRSGRATADDCNHLGVALSRMGKPAEAVDVFRTALRLKPDLPAAHVNLAQAYLALGNSAEAWLEREWQWSARNSGPKRFRSPRWTGEPIGNRVLLVYADEPLSLVREHTEHVKLLCERGCRAIIACRPEAQSELARQFAADRVVPLGDPLPQHELYVPLLSLPWLLSRPTPG